MQSCATLHEQPKSFQIFKILLRSVQKWRRYWFREKRIKWRKVEKKWSVFSKVEKKKWRKFSVVTTPRNVFIMIDFPFIFIHIHFIISVELPFLIRENKWIQFGGVEEEEKIRSEEMRKDAVEMNLSTVLQSISQFSRLSRRKREEVPFKLPIYTSISSRKKFSCAHDDLLCKNRKSHIKKKKYVNLQRWFIGLFGKRGAQFISRCDT